MVSRQAEYQSVSAIFLLLASVVRERGQRAVRLEGSDGAEQRGVRKTGERQSKWNYPTCQSVKPRDKATQQKTKNSAQEHLERRAVGKELNEDLGVFSDAVSRQVKLFDLLGILEHVGDRGELRLGQFGIGATVHREGGLTKETRDQGVLDRRVLPGRNEVVAKERHFIRANVAKPGQKNMS